MGQTRSQGFALRIESEKPWERAEVVHVFLCYDFFGGDETDNLTNIQCIYHDYH